MKSTRGHTRTPLPAARRTALGLLTALAVTLGAATGPLAGTTHAGGLAGGVLPSVATRDSGVGNDSVDAHGSKAGGTGEGVQGFGSKPGLLSGGN